MTTASPTNSIMESVYRALEENDLAIEMGIVGAHRAPVRRLAILAYALAFALNDDPGIDRARPLQHDLLSFGSSVLLEQDTTDEAQGILGAAAHAIYQALTNDEGALWLYAALTGLTAVVRGEAVGGYGPVPPDREFIADHMEFLPNFENGPNIFGSDY